MTLLIDIARTGSASVAMNCVPNTRKGQRSITVPLLSRKPSVYMLRLLDRRLHYLLWAWRRKRREFKAVLEYEDAEPRLHGLFDVQKAPL